MYVPKLTLAFVLIASAAAGQEMPNPQAMQMQVQKIAQERPREAEAAARAFLHLVAQDRVGALDSLKASALDAYWMEVGQLTVQFDMVQNLVRRDSVRAGLVAKMFGLEVYARGLQRAYRRASTGANNQPLLVVDGVPVTSTQQEQIRTQLVALIGQHFDLEDKLRGLEVADIERRLTDVRAETQRRRDKRTEFVKWAVDDIIRDATRPQ
ncbi:MAG TPA: hypothetical protein VK467_05405 [Gemmatimonadales bacterium]|nr:hypothetical protein [Gemmatimonadales bacterium]